MTSSFSHSLYCLSSSLRARPCFLFCSLVSFCGPGAAVGSLAGACACCADTGGSEMETAKTPEMSVRITLDMIGDTSTSRTCGFYPWTMSTSNAQSPAFCDTCPQPGLESQLRKWVASHALNLY